MNKFVTSVDLAIIGDEQMNEIVAMINRASKKAIKVATAKLKNFNFGQPVHIVVVNDPNLVIPEDGVGGSTIHSGLIFIYVHPDNVTENALFTTICHELFHAKRYTILKEIDNRPIAAFISEGLAVAFEEEVRNKKKKETFFLRTITERQQTTKFIKIVEADFFDKDFEWDKNYHSLFFTGNRQKGLPRWAGYEIGYFLTQQYMAKTGKTASELVGEKPERFIPT